MKHRKKISPAAIIGLVSVVLLCMGAVVYFALQDAEEAVPAATAAADDYHTVQYKGETYRYNTDIMSILILGIDSEEEDLDGRSDFVTMLLFDRSDKTYKILQLPRETKTEMKHYTAEGEFDGMTTDFLSKAYYFGNYANRGPMNAMETVSDLLYGVPVINYAVIGLSVLPDVAKIVGPAEIELPDDSLSYVDSSWTAGTVFTVNEDTIETFLRSRNINEDFTNTSRMSRQSLYLQWLFAKISEVGGDSQLNQFEKLYSKVETNLSLNEMDSLYEMAETYTACDPMIYQPTVRYASGQFYDEFYPNEDDLQELVLQLFYRKSE